MTDHQPTDECHSRAAAIDAPITDHVGCVRCGYDLHALVATEQCPECSLPIEVTLFASNDAAWLSNVKSSLQSMLVGHYFMLGSLLAWPVSLIGFCLAMLLQVGSAIDLATRHPDDFTQPARNHWLILLIATGAIAYSVGGVMMVAGIPEGPPLVLLAGSLHALGIAIAWHRVELVMRRGISPRLATTARLLKYLTATMAAGLAALSAYAWGMRASPSGPIVAQPVLLLLLASAMTWLLASLAVLHPCGRATRKQLACLPANARGAR